MILVPEKNPCCWILNVWELDHLYHLFSCYYLFCLIFLCSNLSLLNYFPFCNCRPLLTYVHYSQSFPHFHQLTRLGGYYIFRGMSYPSDCVGEGSSNPWGLINISKCVQFQCLRILVIVISLLHSMDRHIYLLLFPVLIIMVMKFTLTLPTHLDKKASQGAEPTYKPE